MYLARMYVGPKEVCTKNPMVTWTLGVTLLVHTLNLREAVRNGVSEVMSPSLWTSLTMMFMMYEGPKCH